MKCWNCGQDAAFVHEDADICGFWVECVACGEYTGIRDTVDAAKDLWYRMLEMKQVQEARK